MSSGGCAGFWPPCLAEIHSAELGLFVGVVAFILFVRSSLSAGVFLSVVVAFAWLFPVDGRVEPWYLMGGVLSGLLVARGALWFLNRRLPDT